MIADTKRLYESYARRLSKPYEDYAIDELADKYCEALDENKEPDKSVYLSALVLRYWHRVGKLYQQNKNLKLDAEEFLDWLVEAINYACKYRAWQNPAKKVNANQAINQCINTIRLQKYYQSNLDKNKTSVCAVSLENEVGTDDDGASKSYLDITEDELASDDMASIGTESLIQSYIDKKKIVESIILDIIAFEDCEKITKEKYVDFDEEGNEIMKVRQFREFWPYKCISYLNDISNNYDFYLNYFSKKYDIDLKLLTAGLDAIKASNNQKLYRMLDKTINELKQTYKGY